MRDNFVRVDAQPRRDGAMLIHPGARSAPAWQQVPERFGGFIASLTPSAASRESMAEAARQMARLLTRPVVSGRGRRPGSAALSIAAIGSAAKDTVIEPVAGIDFLLVLPDGAREPVGRHTRADAAPTAVRQIVDQLCQRYGAVEIAPSGWIVVCPDRVARGCRLRVRLLPAFVCASGGMLVARSGRTDGGPWQHMDPAAELQRLDEMDRLSGGKARHLVRIAKAWQQTLAVPLSGFAIELLVTMFLSVWLYRRRSLLFYDWMVRDFFFWLAAQGGSQLVIPGSCERLSIGDAWVARATAAAEAAAAASELERDNDAVAAVGQWRAIFGMRFGEPAGLSQPSAPALPLLAAR
jgi:hypothetical protein